MTQAAAHDYLLILGSAAEDGERRLAQARAHLLAHGAIGAASRVVRGPSVDPGDANVYTNQAILLRVALERTAFEAALKASEHRLGRDAQHRGLIDLDLAREYDEHGRLRWENPAKLAHPLFRDLAASVVPAAPAIR